MDANIFVSGKKKLRIQKYPGMCGRGLRFENFDIVVISNGNRTEWSPIRRIRSVIILYTSDNLTSELMGNRSFLNQSRSVRRDHILNEIQYI